MVNPGRPSRACVPCKLRRVKCDLTSPACKRCQKSGRRCPGVLEDSDVSFVDQTAIVRTKAQRNASDKSPSPNDDNSKEAFTILSRVAHSYRHLIWQRKDGLMPKPPALGKELVMISSESQAISLFVENFVVSPVGSKFMNPTLQCLYDIYPSADSSDPMHHALAAVSLMILSQYPDFTHIRPRATAVYAKALRSISDALQDSKRARSNTTLMAIMLSVFFETFLSTNNSVDGYRSHMDGAAAVLRLRADEEHPDEITKRIFNLARTELIMDGHSRMSLESKFKSEAQIQEPQLPSRITSPRDRLLDMAEGIPELMGEAEYVLLESENAQKSCKVLEILQLAQQHEFNLTTWSRDLPVDYGYSSIAVLDTVNPTEIEAAPIWPGIVHVYTDIFIATFLNQYRILRIYVASTIMQCAQYLILRADSDILLSPIPPIASDTVEKLYANAIYTLRTLVDDICASVPYHLGLPPVAGPSYHGPRTKMSTTAMGGYFLIRPLFVASQIDCIPPLQKRWILGRLRTLAGFGFGQAMILSEISENLTNKNDLDGLEDLMEDSWPNATPFQGFFLMSRSASPVAGVARGTLDLGYGTALK